MKLSVLIACYGEQSQRYLNLCLKSLNSQTFQDFETVIISSGDSKPVTRMRDWRVTHIHSPKRMHFPAAITRAYEISDHTTECILLLNDDAIMAKDCIEKMLHVATNVPVIVNPRSNCDDNSRFYFTDSPFRKLQYRIEEMEDLCDQAIGFDDRFPFTLIKQPMVHFYCTMLQRKIWNEVGGVDINLRTGYDDRDFCIRAGRKGYESIVAMHAYALHASGATADLHLSQNDRNFNEEYFKQKFSVGQDS